MDFTTRVRLHAALGEPHRLRIVDALIYTDATFSDLQEVTGLPSNALSHHLATLEEARLVTRHRSEGDARRKYLRVNAALLDELGVAHALEAPASVVFVCTRNSARSQFAAAQWEAATGAPATSVGSAPAPTVNATAIEVAAEFGLDLSASVPHGYDAVSGTPDLVVSVCDRAHENGVPAGRTTLHWSTPDPVAAGTKRAFRTAFADISDRIDRLAGPPAQPEGTPWQ
jgi:protein-tyrosine-phosphatase/DNA-binding transcriptional ArsR family regulator